MYLELVPSDEVYIIHAPLPALMALLPAGLALFAFENLVKTPVDGGKSAETPATKLS